MKDLILAIDQGTSGSKSIVFTSAGEIISDGRCHLETSFFSDGFVEQDPEEIFSSVLSAVKDSLSRMKPSGYEASDIRCCGISNQRETFLLWDKAGKPLTKAVVWQCKRSVGICKELIEQSEQQFIRNKTGLFIDPYFSGTKLMWLFKNMESLRTEIKNGNAYFGTIDTWLLFRLTGGKSYKTDYTNASRTLLFNLKQRAWDKEILRKFDMPELNLPEPLPSSSYFGESDFDGLFTKNIPITAMIGDSHAASFGERCFTRGTAKATMGTGSSILLNTDDYIEPEKTSMVSTICWSTEEKTAYALEGIIISCGSILTWFAEKMNLISNGKEADEIALRLADNGGVYIVPAFSGLGAPWWKMDSKASVHGLTFGSDKSHVIRAGLESIAYQIASVIKTMEKEIGQNLSVLRIDGGVSSSPFITTALASLNTAKIKRCGIREASALGAAFLAGLNKKIYSSITDLESLKYDDVLINPENRNVIENGYKEWLLLMGKLD